MESVYHGLDVHSFIYDTYAWCSSVAHICGQLEEGAGEQSALSICAFSYM